MILRLSIVTGLIAMFAMSFSLLVAMPRHGGSPISQGAGDCLSAGLVCAPQGSARS